MSADELKTKTICPGCGTANPENIGIGDGFSCKVCEWESDDPLPTVGEITSGDRFNLCTHVNLSAFLRTLFAEVSE